LVSTAGLSVSETTTSCIHPYSSYEKSIIIERTVQYIKDRTTEECFDATFNAKENQNAS
jgi:hypothetical protein